MGRGGAGRDRRRREGRTGQAEQRKVHPDTTLTAFALASFLLSIRPVSWWQRKGFQSERWDGAAPSRDGRGTDTNYSGRRTQLHRLGLPGGQQPTASKSELNEFGTESLVMSGGWKGPLFPNIHLRGGNDWEQAQTSSSSSLSKTAG